MEELYLAHILEHYREPQHKGVPETYDIKKEGENPSCGDRINLFISFADDGSLSSVQFDGEGCAISIAATSMLAEYVRGMKKDEVLKLTPDDVYKMLGVTVNPAREKCALLSYCTLIEGIESQVS